MTLRQATLIQDIREFRVLLEPLILRAACTLALPPLHFQRALHWIISEEMELCHGLFDRQHLHNHSSYSAVHREVDRQLPVRSLSVIFNEHVAVPQVYTGSNQVDVVLAGDDLYFFYYSLDVSRVLFPFHPKQLHLT